jgi:hypothetical protein
MSKIRAKRDYCLVKGESHIRGRLTEWNKDYFIFYPFPIGDIVYPPSILVHKQSGEGEKGWTLEF